MGWGNVRKPFPHIKECEEIEQVVLGNKFQCEENVRNFHMCGIDERKRAFGPQKPKTTLLVNLSEFGFFFYHDRLWCSGDLELQCHVTETNFLCAGSRLAVHHDPSI